MTTTTEREMVLYYLNNLLNARMFREMENRICDWFEENAKSLIGYEVEDFWGARHRHHWRTKGEEKSPEPPRNAATIRSFLKGKQGKYTIAPEIKAVIHAFQLAPEYHEMLALRMYAVQIPVLHNLVDSSFREHASLHILAGMLGVTLRNFEKLYASSSELLTKGLFEPERRRDLNETSEMFNDIIMSHCRTPDAVKQVVLGKPLKAKLKSAQFSHLQEDYHLLRSLLANALAKKQRGINLLIYGKPGTGKTELVKTLCKEIGIPLYAVSGNAGDERTGGERRSDLAAALSVLQDDHHSVLLMDEAEDVFDACGAGHALLGDFFAESRRAPSKSKLFFNKLLENNPIPVVWVSNSIRGVDPAHIRRFSYALHMEAPDDSVQTRIWSQAARKNKVSLSPEKINTLAKTYDITPALIDTSLRTAALVEDSAAIEKTIESLQMATSGRVEKKALVAEHPFSTALLNCDLDLGTLKEKIVALPGMNFSLCLYGIPGSGKSAYARHLAEALKMRVLHKRASDLVDMYVGQTERNIAAAFAEARRKKMLLIFDEADSFLRDRRYAQRNWEVSEVNEMLTQMESHPLPFVCTTNLMDDLDQASLRRFTFKVKYDYLTRKQVEQAFVHFFGESLSTSLCAVAISGLNCLSPGDFAVVAKKTKIFGNVDHQELLKMLRAEQEVKEDGKTKPFGFTTGE